MILSYSRTSFVPAIIQNIKKHTLRRNNRWKAGMKIHHWLGNPRNTKSTPPPFCFHEGECNGTEQVRICREKGVRHGFGVYILENFYGEMYTESHELTTGETESLCHNDGLTPDEFRDWFLPPGTDEWQGNIIHYTPLRYAT